MDRMSGLGNYCKDELCQISESANLFRAGKNGVGRILSTRDRKVDFIEYGSSTLGYVHSSMGYPAIYEVREAVYRPTAKAVLMDLDGTTVHSEPFWIWIIQQTIARLLDDRRFELEDADLPYVSGHSVSEHLQYCLNKYCPEKTVEEARTYYFDLTNREMDEIIKGRGRQDAFVPAPGLKEFLYSLKKQKIKIGLVTSGLYEKAWPEILSAFRMLDMGDPVEFYDAIITAGTAFGRMGTGTLGELSPKPHPWLYAETARVGLGITENDKPHVLAIEDSAAGVLSVRLAGFTCIGMEGGNIRQSGVSSLCGKMTSQLTEVLNIISNGIQ